MLDTLLEAGLPTPYGCRAGICQSCLLRASAGEIPDAAQEGLKHSLKEQGWFLACRCRPEGALRVDFEAAAPPPVAARIVSKQRLAPRVMGLWLEPDRALDYHAGQYVTAWRDDTTGRCYSLASLPEESLLEFHVARVDGGALSPWLHETAGVGDVLDLRGPIGDCFYSPDDPEQPLVLIGTGTGLAPLYGVVRDALRHGHSGPIHLFHGARTTAHLYYRDKLRALSDAFENLHYYPSVHDVDGATLPPDVMTGAIDQLVKHHLPALAGWRVFLSGAPDIVNHLRKQCFLAGAASGAIHADPFA